MQKYKCRQFEKDLKRLSKKCKNQDLEREISSTIDDLLGKYREEEIEIKLIILEELILYKTRIKGCDKGKRGGMRLIWAILIKEKIAILIRLYSKTETDNIKTQELARELQGCLKTLYEEGHNI